MLRFTVRATQFSKCRRWFGETEFVQRVVRFKATEMKAQEVLKDIQSLATSQAILATQPKLFLQLQSSLKPEEVDQAKEAFLSKAGPILRNTKGPNQGGHELRLFIIRSFSGKTFSRPQMKKFLELNFIDLVRQNRTEELSKVSLDVYVNILESCIFNGMLSPEDLYLCTSYALEKAQFAQSKLKTFSNMAVIHAFYLKKVKGALEDPRQTRAVDSFLQIINKAVGIVGQLAPEEVPDLLVFMTQVISAADIFDGHSKENVFQNNWHLLELEANKVFKRTATIVADSVSKMSEPELLTFLDEFASVQNIYSSESIKQAFYEPLATKLERSSKQLSSGAVTSIIGFCMKLDKTFAVAPKYLNAVEISISDYMQSLSSAAVILEIFSKHDMGEHVQPFIMKLEKFLPEVLNNKELITDKNVVRHLVQIFQSLVTINRGSIQLFKNFLETFKSPAVLDLLGPIPLFIKFIPALGIKTKKLAGAITNINEESSKNVVEITKKMETEIRPALIDIWKALDTYISSRLDAIELDKLASILLHFVYGQIVVSDMRVFGEASKRLKGSMEKFGPRQLAQTVYSLSRISMTAVRGVISEGVEQFHKKTKVNPQNYSQERATVLWASANSGSVNLDTFEKLLRLELDNIPNYTSRVYVQLIHAVGMLSPDNFPTELYKKLLVNSLSFYQKEGKNMALQEVLGSAYHILLLPPRPELKEAYDNLYNEISHLIANQQKYLSQTFILVYYLYLLLCHRYIRGAPVHELGRLMEIVSKYQGEIMQNYAESKRNTVSRTEDHVSKIILENGEAAGIGKISEQESKVIEVRNMNFLMLPSERVQKMLATKQVFKDFTEKCLLVPYTIDILVGDKALEVNGPVHYYTDLNTGKYVLNGHSKLKKEFIEALGMKYIELPVWKLDKIIFSKKGIEQAKELAALINSAEDGSLKL